MKLKQIKPKNLLKALLKLGFVIKRQKGSHVFLEVIVKNKKCFTTISLHNEPLPKGTLKAILKQTGADEEEIKNII